MNNNEMSAGTAAQKSTTDEANNVNPQLQQCNVSSRHILSTINAYNEADNVTKNKVDAIVSLLEGLDISQAKKVTRIADSFVYRVSQQKLVGIALA